MLGDFSDSKILRETLSQLVFGQASEDVPDLLSSALDLLTSQKYVEGAEEETHLSGTLQGNF